MAKKKNQSNHKSKASDGTVTVDLKIDMNCESCAGKVVKFVHSLDGVESVRRGENDWMKITVVGKVDPIELCENVKGKIKKNVELVSPTTTKKNDGDGEQEKQQKQQTVVVKEESTHKKFSVTTTVMKLELHCQGCIKKIQKLVRKTEGFVEMSVDKSNDLVTVKGGMDMDALMAMLEEKLNKKVEIVQAKGGSGKKGKHRVIEGEKKRKDDGGDGEGNENGGGGPMVAGYNHGMDNFTGQGQYMYPQYLSWPEYTYNYTHATQITQMFNDENPNACVVM